MVIEVHQIWTKQEIKYYTVKLHFNYLWRHHGHKPSDLIYITLWAHKYIFCQSCFLGCDTVWSCKLLPKFFRNVGISKYLQDDMASLPRRQPSTPPQPRELQTADVISLFRIREECYCRRRNVFIARTDYKLSKNIIVIWEGWYEAKIAFMQEFVH